MREITAPGPISILTNADDTDLRPWGFAPGGYSIICQDCGAGVHHQGDKRAWRCFHHAHLARLISLHQKEIQELKSRHDKRVTELLRACSTEVIKRRVLMAKLKVAIAALLKAGIQFREYARQHRAKGTPEADFKAHVNDEMADTMDHARTVYVNPDDYGRA